MSVYSNINLYMYNKNEKKWKNINPSDVLGKKHSLNCFCGGSFLNFIERNFNRIDKDNNDFEGLSFDYVENYELDYVKALNNDNYYPEIVYLRDCFLNYLDENGILSDTDDIYYHEELEAKEFEGLLTTIQYAQLLDKEKQHYIPVILQETETDKEIWDCIVQSIRYWVDAMQKERYLTMAGYNTDLIKIVINVVW